MCIGNTQYGTRYRFSLPTSKSRYSTISQHVENNTKSIKIRISRVWSLKYEVSDSQSFLLLKCTNVWKLASRSGKDDDLAYKPQHIAAQSRPLIFFVFLSAPISCVQLYTCLDAINSAGNALSFRLNQLVGHGGVMVSAPPEHSPKPSRPSNCFGRLSVKSVVPEGGLVPKRLEKSCEASPVSTSRRARQAG